jgi:hypothetical protein
MVIVSFAAATLSEFLAELSDALLLEDADPQEWLVCGGAALLLQGLTVRVTRDVDVLSHTGRDGTFALSGCYSSSFSMAAERAIRRVAAAHPELTNESGRAWVNLAASQLAAWGLPSGYETRVTRMCVGDRLTLYLLARSDLIALKLFAAADDLSPRQPVHESDLFTLAPTEVELEAAIAWVKSMPDPQSRIAPALKDIVQELGFHELASYL